MQLKRSDILIVGFVAALALLGGVAWLGWRHTARTQETAELLAHSQEAQSNLNRLLSLIDDIETGARGFVVTGDPAFLEPFESGLQAVVEQRRKLEQLIPDAEQKANLSALDPLIAERIRQAQRTVDLRQNSGFEAARQEVASSRGKIVMDNIRAKFARMDAKGQTLLGQRSAAAKREASAANLLSAIGTGLSFVLFIAVFTFLLRENRLRQRAEERTAGSLKAQNAFKTALDEHAIVAITDARGKITYVNDKFCAISKYSPEELLGRDHRIINSGHHPKAFIRELWQTITSGHVWKGELKNRAKDSTFYWVATTIVPFLDEHGKPAQYIAIRADITERKQAEEKIVQLNADLRAHATQLGATNTELESFAYSVSHDLRAPLRGMDGFSQALLDDYAGKFDATGQDYLRRIRAGAQRMGQLIDDLLNLSLVTRSEMTLDPVNLTALAREAIAELQPQQAGRAVQWKVSDPLTARGDTRLLQLALVNLLANALKFTGKCAHARIEFGQQAQGAELAFFVRDNGAGFDMAYADRLFGAFQRLHTPLEFPGTGIGLATVQRIIHRHGGRVWADAQPGKGATFYFTLPAAE